jgi:hypothetical protein
MGQWTISGHLNLDVPDPLGYPYPPPTVPHIRPRPTFGIGLSFVVTPLCLICKESFLYAINAKEAGKE